MGERQRNPCSSFFILITVLLVGLFMLTGSQALADERLKGRGKNTEWQEQKEYQKEYQKHRQEMERENRKHYEGQARESRKYERERERGAAKHSREIRNRRDYNKRPDYHKHRGYRERPYDKRRHYIHHDHKGHRYNYQGHWRSWEEWDRYARKHPEIYRHGGYYRENAHLMFRFCDPGTGNCFFLSIGR